ncbi:FxsA family protein [Oceaniglobus trochenteri]|uniref:FxsA family protein n=1 Tax=Oceaniglobus trochenteri TaxID=2763260 RepID=UPI001CFFA842|nr:FxsA family protein [Oceaniglobus trochenteri]
MWLFALFLAVPIVEIALFIQVGGWIGLWPTLGIVILTAVLGTWLVRTQGALAMSQLRGSFNELRDPTEPLAHGAMILLAGALLLTPGFFTDATGFALLIPPVRQAVFRFLRARIKVQTFEYGQARGPGARPGPAGRGDVIDGDYVEVDPPKKPTHDTSNSPSGWTRH